jgi:hypothetical protein
MRKSMRHILFLSLLLLLWSAEFSFATDDNDNVRWKNFHLQDINGPVYTVTTGPGGEVYIGGSFTEANGLAATNIVRWYNGTWSVLGSGLSGGSLAAVYAIAVAENGTVYAGGQFTTAGGKTVNNIARWDGSNWSALGNGTNDRVNALALGSNGAVYAGGAFTTASGISAGAVALWQNGQWNRLGMGLREGKAEVMALAVHEDELYAGGNFLQAGETSTFNIARWNGNQWLSLDSGIAPYTACVYALAFQDNKLYAAGDFRSPFSSIAANVLSWDGISWAREATFTAPVRAITFTAGGELAAAGEFTAVGVSTATTAVGYAALRTRGSWESLGTGLNGSVSTLAVLPDNSLIAGGIFDLAGPVIANHIARWNYEQWSTLGTTPSTGINGSIYAVAVAPNGDVYVGGSFTIAGTTTANSIARWNGNQWYPLGAGIEGTVNAIAIARNGTVYAGGSFTRAGGAPANAIALWDGLRWRSLNDNQAHARIYALALADDDLLYAGGLFASIGETSANCIARWSHSRWSAMSSGVNSTVYAIACRGGQVFIGGSFAFTAGSDLNGIAEWNGSRWLALAKGVEGSVSALSLDEQGQLYAGGDFTMNGSTIVRIGRWDGLRWHALGSGVNHDVSSLVTSSDGTLYAAGYFSIAGGTIASRIALWKNDRWYPLGSGLSGTPAALALSTNKLYVAGVLNGAGGNPTHNFAAWQLCDFLPSVTPDGPLTLCRGAQLTLTAQKGFASYVWNTGATGPKLTVNEAGTYSVLVTDDNGCSAESSPVVVGETSATLIVASTKRTCAGSTVQLSVTGADSYHWSPTDGLSCTDCSNPTVILSSTIVYTVEGRTAEGCTSTATVKLQVHLPAEKPKITITNHTTLTSTPAFSYQWYLEDKPLPGAIEQVYEASESGTYTVQTTNEEGCMALSVPVKVTLPTSDIGPVSSLSEPQLKLYPIPSTGSFTVEMSCPDRTALSLDIRDLFGRVVYTTFLSPSFRHTFPVELHVVPGVYLLVIRTQNTQLVREIIVQ